MEPYFGFDLPEGSMESVDRLRDAMESASNDGNVEAAYSLAVCYATGEWISHREPDGPIDQAQAVRWYRTAAEQGHGEAQYNLGLMLLLGEGQPPDTASGLAWLESAVSSGYLYAAKVLSELYEAGSHGLAKSSSLAAHWRTVAESGLTTR